MTSPSFFAPQAPPRSEIDFADLSYNTPTMSSTMNVLAAPVANTPHSHNFSELDDSDLALNDFLSQFGDFVVYGGKNVKMVRPIRDADVRRHKSWFIYW